MSQLLSRVLSQHNSIDVLRGLISGKPLRRVAPRAGLSNLRPFDYQSNALPAELSGISVGGI